MLNSTRSPRPRGAGCAISTDSQLAEQQAALVRALTGQGPPPVGFDAGRVGVVARSLVMKRLRSVRRVWPGLARALGDDFDRLFVNYATGRPIPRRGGALADGDAFVAHLVATENCPDEARRERLAIALQYRRTADGLVRRSRWAIVVRCAMFRSRPRVLFGVRLSRWAIQGSWQPSMPQPRWPPPRRVPAASADCTHRERGVDSMPVRSIGGDADVG
jgi:hypothetical protein